MKLYRVKAPWTVDLVLAESIDEALAKYRESVRKLMAGDKAEDDPAVAESQAVESIECLGEVY